MLFIPKIILVHPLSYPGVHILDDIANQVSSFLQSSIACLISGDNLQALVSSAKTIVVVRIGKGSWIGLDTRLTGECYRTFKCKNQTLLS